MDSPMIASLESCLERQRQRPRALTFALRHPVLVAGSFLLALMIALALFAPWIVPHDPTEMNVIQRLKPPSAEFPLGTDALGRDILSRTLYGARVSLLVGVSVALFSALTGILIGTMAGFNRLADKIIMRFMDGMMAIPGILLAVAAGAAFALYSIAGRRLAAPEVDGLSLTACIFVVAAALLAVPLASQDLGFATEPRSMLVLAWLGVMATAVAYLLYQSAMRHITAATAATLALAEPMVANLLAIGVLHEPFTWMMGCGVALVLAGLALLARA